MAKNTVNIFEGIVNKGSSTVDSLFDTDRDIIENVKDIDINKLVEFKEHPFKPQKGDEFQELVKSIHENGLFSPIIVRPKDNATYEILAGHNRVNACKILTYRTIPCIVKEGLDDDSAKILVTESNLRQRQAILPSEKAFAYKMQLEAYKHQGKRMDLTEMLQDETSVHCGQKLTSRDVVAVKNNETANQVQRYIRLTFLIPKLLEFVDEGLLDFIPAVDISYLDEQQQNAIETMLRTNDKIKITKIIAMELKVKAQEGTLTVDDIFALEETDDTPKPIKKISIPKSYQDRFNGMDEKKANEIIEKALALYFEE